ncbi:metal-sulfur cluster assembly factor [Halovenus sp. HT40]|uniref:metal-sulfur cluster assembly factor n=1 Tax=Halovenus sp. HT40 TaxID=3126691 RepID=UPI00300F01B5
MAANDSLALQARNRLDEIVDPCSEARGTDISIVEMGLLKSIDVSDGHVHIDLRITSPSCMMVGYFIEQAEKRVGALDGVEEVTLTTDAGMDWREEMMAESALEQRQEHQQALADKYKQEQSDSGAQAQSVPISKK